MKIDLFKILTSQPDVLEMDAQKQKPRSFVLELVASFVVQILAFWNNDCMCQVRMIIEELSNFLSLNRTVDYHRNF